MWSLWCQYFKKSTDRAVYEFVSIIWQELGLCRILPHQKFFHGYVMLCVQIKYDMIHRFQCIFSEAVQNELWWCQDCYWCSQYSQWQTGRSRLYKEVSLTCNLPNSLGTYRIQRFSTKTMWSVKSYIEVVHYYTL